MFNRNTLKTFVLLAALGGLMIAVGSIWGTTGAAIGLGIGLVFVGGSYWFSDTLAIKSARAVPVTREEQPRLYAIVEDLAMRADMPMPKVYISPNQQPNAFATGRNPNHAAVAVTAGILQVLDEEELRAVLAHEMSHVANRDILIGSVAAAVAMGITFIARMILWGAMFAGRGRDNPFGLLAMAILAPIAAILLQMALSRSREFEADRSGAELIGSGDALARALEKIEAYAKQTPMQVAPEQASAYIINPFTGRQVRFSNLFRTHPPTADRVARLANQSHHI